MPLEEYQNNLKEIVIHAKKTCKNIVLITPPPFEASMWRIFCEGNHRLLIHFLMLLIILQLKLIIISS